VQEETPPVKLVIQSMSYSKSVEHTAAVVAALAELGVRPGERVLIMLPDGPGFAEVFAGTIQHQAVPLPVNPRLSAHDIAATAAKAGARLLLALADQIQTLTDLDTEPPILIDGPHRPCVAALRLCSLGGKPSRKQVVLLPHSPIAPTDTRLHYSRAPEGPPA
jgi:long-chain acyl-CoA synthetase